MKTTRAVASVLVIGALVVTACGGDDDDDAAPSTSAIDDSSASTPGESAPSTEATATTSGASASTPSSDETAPSSDETSPSGGSTDGATELDPSLPPVIIGFHNLEGGSFSIPETRIGFESGVEYVNTELGGINGHELQVEYCNVDVTPESTVNCANQFVESDVVAAVQGFDLAVDAALPVLAEAGILEIAPQPLGAAINSQVGDAIVLGSSTQGGQAITGLILAAESGAKKLAYVLADVPSMRSVFETVSASATELGIEVEAYYYSQPTDWTTFAATTVSGGADAISMFGVDADYLAAIPAFRGAGFTGQLNANTFAQVDQLDPALRADVLVGGSFYNVDMVNDVPAEAQADIEIYERYRESMSGVERPTPPRTGFYMAVMTADILRQVDDPTSAQAVKEQAVEASGHVFFTDQNYDCATPSWPDTTSCAGITIYAALQEDGSLEVLPNQPIDVSAVLPAD